MTACVPARLPELNRTITRSPHPIEDIHLQNEAMLSTPALVRESDAKTTPSLSRNADGSSHSGDDTRSDRLTRLCTGARQQCGDAPQPPATLRMSLNSLSELRCSEVSQESI